MLRTNTKKARLNVQRYIMEGFDASNYDLETPEDFKSAAAVIWNVFKAEKPYYDSYIRRHMMSEQELFTEWCKGLPCIIDTCYYYNRSAVDDLATILEETDEEKSRYTEERAENLLSYLIYSEVKKGADKQ